MENKKIDYLRVDEPIPGQNFCCLSFAEPKNSDLLQNREAYFVTKFVRSFIENYKTAYEFVQENGEEKLVDEAKKNMDISYENILEKYNDYKKINLQNMQTEWENMDEMNQETTIRGLKVRGVFPTQAIASQKAKELQKSEPAFDVFVGQVGYWMPFNPQNIGDINAEYDEEQLNQLIKSKNDEDAKRTLEFEERKRKMLDETKKQEEERKREKAEVLEINDENDESLLEVLDENLELEEVKTPAKKSSKKVKKPKKNQKKKTNNKRRRR